MFLLVSRQAPDFVAPAVLSNGVIIDRVHLHTTINGRYALLFFNPLALTLVCSSELSALDQRAEEFRQRDVEILGITLDALHRHSIWRNIPADHLRPISYPLVVDVHGCICRDYGLAAPGGTFASRGLFLLDRHGVVRYQAINDLPLHGEIDDLLRIVDALQQSTPTSKLPRSAIDGPTSEGNRTSIQQHR
ncbi:MAG TPA: redoxin domain-containing protein [Gammaproteobacteria bacterium]|nr:redoxin domain-containing protein [Gammaproteobacteria bacterium]